MVLDLYIYLFVKTLIILQENPTPLFSVKYYQQRVLCRVAIIIIYSLASL